MVLLSPGVTAADDVTTDTCLAHLQCHFLRPWRRELLTLLLAARHWLPRSHLNAGLSKALALDPDRVTILWQWIHATLGSFSLDDASSVSPLSSLTPLPPRIDTMKVDELKRACKQLRLSPVCLKKDLQIRLREASSWNASSSTSRSLPHVPHTPQHVFLMLGERLQAFPWESLMMPNLSVSRVPNLVSLRQLRHRHSITTITSTSVTPLKASARAPSLANTCFVINPDAWLVQTQPSWSPLVTAMQPIWVGSLGAPGLPPETLKRALASRAFYLFAGHGAGSRVLSMEALTSLSSCASPLLIGCSSGALTDNGDYDPTGIAHAYLRAGSVGVIGMLWDVTDRDIDRFSLSLLSRALGCEKEYEGGIVEEYSHRHSPPPGKTLNRLIPPSRHVCKLPYLTGLAAISYGLPLTYRKSGSSHHKLANDYF